LEEIGLINEGINIDPLENRYTYRLRKNPLDEFSESEFKKRYRLSKDTALYVVNLIRNDIKSASNRAVDVSPELQLLITLRFYSRGTQPCYRLQIRNVQGYNEQVVASTRFTMRTTRNADRS
jgi:hypothetical protein